MRVDGRTSVEDHELASQLLEVVPSGLLVWGLASPQDDTSLVLLYANPEASRILDVELSGRRGDAVGEIFPSASAASIRAIADTCRDGRARRIGYLPAAYRKASVCTSLRLTAAVRPLRNRRALVVLERASMLDALGADVDNAAAPDAHSLGQFLESVVEHLPAMVFVKSAHDLRFQRFNRAGEELLGVPREALIGKDDYDLFPREQADFFVQNDREVLARKTLKDIPREPIETPHGTRWLHTRKLPILDERGEPRHLLGISIDVTDQKRAEEILRSSHEELEARVAQRTAELERQISARIRTEEALARTEELLRHSQKMEAIGRLAGGVAHDFNNLLSVVLGYSDLVLRQLPSHSLVRRHVEQINHAGVRAADLTRQLLAFSRRQVMSPRLVDLNDVLRGLEEMLSRLLGEDIELTIRLTPNLTLIEADPSQLEQVVMNLAVNARDAMPTGGRLLIETSSLELDAQFTTSHLGAEQGPHVRLVVSDTGIGMDKATMARIFEPFFTTKESGKGTGLGLSTVFGIVKQSGGFVWVRSEAGEGATFEVYLPAAKRLRSDARGVPHAPTTMGGSETILLVEDQEQVRTLAATCLRELGYRVLEACGPAEAINKALSAKEPIDLLLTDVVMPGMGGRALAEHLKHHHAAMRVLFMSGYTEDAVCRHGVPDDAATFLQKPLTPSLLALRTREALDAGLVHPTSATPD